MEANIATHTITTKTTAMHKCIKCNKWFENKYLYSNQCKDCK